MNFKIINNVLSKLTVKFKNLENKIKKIMNRGLLYCFILCLISTAILFTYQLYSFPILFNIGIALFRSSLMFIVMFLMCGIGFDTILNQ